MPCLIRVWKQITVDDTYCQSTACFDRGAYISPLCCSCVLVMCCFLSLPSFDIDPVVMVVFLMEYCASAVLCGLYVKPVKHVLYMDPPTSTIIIVAQNVFLEGWFDLWYVLHRQHDQSFIIEHLHDNEVILLQCITMYFKKGGNGWEERVLTDYSFYPVVQCRQTWSAPHCRRAHDCMYMYCCGHGLLQPLLVCMTHGLQSVWQHWKGTLARLERYSVAYGLFTCTKPLLLASSRKPFAHCNYHSH